MSWPAKFPRKSGKITRSKKYVKACGFCAKPIKWANRVALNSDKSQHKCLSKMV